jgi:hypothetical protein
VPHGTSIGRDRERGEIKKEGNKERDKERERERVNKTVEQKNYKIQTKP